MPQINWKHVLLGGLLAGLVLNLFGMGAAHLFLAEQIHSLHQRLQLDQDRSFPMDFLKHLGLRFALGLILIWLYAAIRPRFGPGPRTAAIAGVAVWLLAYGLFLSAMVFLRLLSDQIALAAFAWGFLETQAASLAGAWLYREP